MRCDAKECVNCRSGVCRLIDDGMRVYIQRDGTCSNWFPDPDKEEEDADEYPVD